MSRGEFFSRQKFIEAEIFLTYVFGCGWEARRRGPVGA